MKVHDALVKTLAGVGAVLALAGVVRADDEPWAVRLQGLYIGSSNNSDAVSVPGALSIPKDGVHESDKWAPAVNLEYFFLRNWSTELTLTYPQNHDVTVKNVTLDTGRVPSAVIGTFKELPPTLTVKYNFLPDGDWRPYIGAGVNVTLLMDVRLNVPTVGAVTLNHATVGPAAQAGFDYRIVGNWYANMDIKYVMIEPTLRYDGAKIATIKMDPILAGVGISYRF